MQKLITLILLYYSILSFKPAFAYIGPGLGVGFIAVIVGLILTICVAIFTVIYFPIKKLILKSKKNKKKK